MITRAERGGKGAELGASRIKKQRRIIGVGLVGLATAHGGLRSRTRLSATRYPFMILVRRIPPNELAATWAADFTVLVLLAVMSVAIVCAGESLIAAQATIYHSRPAEFGLMSQILSAVS